MPPRIMEIKRKTNKWNLLELKSFYPAKETIKNQKSQLTDWEYICKWCDQQGISLQNLQAVHMSQYQSNKQANQKKIFAEDLKTLFSQKDIQMTKRYMKRYPTSLVIKFSSVQSLSRVRLFATQGITDARPP